MARKFRWDRTIGWSIIGLFTGVPLIALMIVIYLYSGAWPFVVGFGISGLGMLSAYLVTRP